MRERKKRDDGTEIDPVKNLAEFVQSFPSTGAPEPPAPTAQTDAAPSAPVATPAPEPITDPEFAGKSAEEIIALAKAERQRAADADSRAQRVEADLREHKTRTQIEETARKVLAEQRPTPQPLAPQEDPRWKEVDDLWFTEPTKARSIMKQIQTEEFSRTLAEDRQKAKQEIFAELTEQQQRTQANNAFNTAMQTLKNSGQQVTQNRVAAVYQTITRRPSANMPNPYFDRGGPLDAGVVVEAFRELFGAPVQYAAPTVPAPAAPLVTPPGSGRPAPAAAAPAQTRATPINADTRKEYERIAQHSGLDVEKMLNRRREREARERKG